MDAKQRLEFINRRIPEIHPDAFLKTGTGSHEKPGKYGYYADEGVNNVIRMSVMECMENVSVMDDGEIKFFQE